MDKFENYEFLNSLSMSPEEINFILLDPSFTELSTTQQRKTVKSAIVEILRKDSTGNLLLPFIKPEHR